MAAWPTRPFEDPRLAAVADLIARWPGGPVPTRAALQEGLRAHLAPAGLTLVEPAPRPRRRAAELPGAIYEQRIAATGEIPTRPGDLHDAFNALAWAAFPAAKLALTTRIAALQRARLGADGRQPGARDREHDRLALLDEGGLILLDDGAGPRGVVVGHAIWQHAALGHRDVRAAAVALPALERGARWRWGDATPEAVRARVDAAWRALVTSPERLHAAMAARAGQVIDDGALWRSPPALSGCPACDRSSP
ncbi:MAG: DUF3025 domain-containing protein [Kofleriaceae bacterium]